MHLNMLQALSSRPKICPIVFRYIAPQKVMI